MSALACFLSAVVLRLQLILCGLTHCLRGLLQLGRVGLCHSLQPFGHLLASLQPAQLHMAADEQHWDWHEPVCMTGLHLVVCQASNQLGPQMVLRPQLSPAGSVTAHADGVMHRAPDLPLLAQHMVLLPQKLAHSVQAVVLLISSIKLQLKLLHETSVVRPATCFHAAAIRGL